MAKMVTSGSALPLAFAWASWSIQVLRPLLLAGLAWSVSRDLAPDKAVSPPDASPYRGGPIPSETEPLPESTRPHVENADNALARYRTAVVLRVAAFFAPVPVLFLAMVSAPSGRSGRAVIVTLISLASVVSEAALLASTSRLPRPVAHIATKTSVLLTLAKGGLWMAIALDTLSVIAGLVASDEGAAALLVFTSYVLGGALSVLSFLGVARALAHLGERLGDERVIGLARLLLAECIASGALVLASVFVTLAGGREAAFLVAALLLLGAGGIVVGGFVCALKLLAATRAALRSALLPPVG